MKDFRLDGKRHDFGEAQSLGAAIAEKFSEAGGRQSAVSGRTKRDLSRIKGIVENNHRNCWVIEETFSSSREQDEQVKEH